MAKSPVRYNVDKSNARNSILVMLFPGSLLAVFFFTFETFNPEWYLMLVGLIGIIGFMLYQFSFMNRKAPVILLQESGFQIYGYPFIPWENFEAIKKHKMVNPESLRDHFSLVVRVRNPDEFFSKMSKQAAKRSKRGAWVLGGHAYIDETDFEGSCESVIRDVKLFHPNLDQFT